MFEAVFFRGKEYTKREDIVALNVYEGTDEEPILVPESLLNLFRKDDDSIVHIEPENFPSFLGDIVILEELCEGQIFRWNRETHKVIKLCTFNKEFYMARNIKTGDDNYFDKRTIVIRCPFTPSIPVGYRFLALDGNLCQVEKGADIKTNNVTVSLIRSDGTKHGLDFLGGQVICTFYPIQDVEIGEEIEIYEGVWKLTKLEPWLKNDFVNPRKMATIKGECAEKIIYGDTYCKLWEV